MASEDNPKAQALKKHRTLNPHPERVSDKRFAEDPFFDAQDLLQVKYEMVRSVRAEGRPLAQSARDFGFSRPSLYKALQAFERRGLAGLVPRRRGPRQAHKLGPEQMEFLEQARLADPRASPRRLAGLIQQRFRLSVHPRSVERALARKKKRRRGRGPGRPDGSGP